MRSSKWPERSTGTWTYIKAHRPTDNKPLPPLGLPTDAGLTRASQLHRWRSRPCLIDSGSQPRWSPHWRCETHAGSLGHGAGAAGAPLG